MPAVLEAGGSGRAGTAGGRDRVMNVVHISDILRQACFLLLRQSCTGTRLFLQSGEGGTPGCQIEFFIFLITWCFEICVCVLGKSVLNHGADEFSTLIGQKVVTVDPSVTCNVILTRWFYPYVIVSIVTVRSLYAAHSMLSKTNNKDLVFNAVTFFYIVRRCSCKEGVSSVTVQELALLLCVFSVKRQAAFLFLSD